MISKIKGNRGRVVRGAAQSTIVCRGTCASSVPLLHGRAPLPVIWSVFIVWSTQSSSHQPESDAGQHGAAVWLQVPRGRPQCTEYIAWARAGNDLLLLRHARDLDSSLRRQAPPRKPPSAADLHVSPAESVPQPSPGGRTGLDARRSSTGTCRGPHVVPTWSPRGPHVVPTWSAHVTPHTWSAWSWFPCGSRVGGDLSETRQEPRGDLVETRLGLCGDQM